MPQLAPHYNIAPTQPIAVVREPRRLELLRWGLAVPGTRGPGINVRVESVVRAPAYRDSFRKRRCLVIVDGFYEWQARGKAKQPFFVRRERGAPFALAGIWASSTTTDGEVTDACAIVTGRADGVVAELHNRMPLIIPAMDYARWLDPNVKATDVADLLIPSADGLIAYPVSTLVNNATNDDARCIEPL